MKRDRIADLLNETPLQKYRKVLTKEYGGNVKNVGIDGCQLYTIDAVMDRIVLVVVDGRVERN